MTTRGPTDYSYGDIGHQFESSKIELPDARPRHAVKGEKKTKESHAKHPHAAHPVKKLTETIKKVAHDVSGHIKSKAHAVLHHKAPLREIKVETASSVQKMPTPLQNPKNIALANAEYTIFTSDNAKNIKHACSEIYSAEAAFLDKLRSLRGDKSLSHADKAKLEELITNTKHIVDSLNTFDQLGAKQNAELRTLISDFGTNLNIAIEYKSGQKGNKADGKLLESIRTLEQEIGTLSGSLRNTTGPEKRKSLSDDLIAKRDEIRAKIDTLRANKDPALVAIAKIYDRITALKAEMSALPQVPTGVLDNLTTVLSKHTVESQYKLLTHFKDKQEKLLNKNDPAAVKYLPFFKKMTDALVLVTTLVSNIPEGLRPKELTDLQAIIAHQLDVANTNK